jgi:hypothetical protein
MILGVGALVPFGAGTVYDDSVGCYKIAGQSDCYWNLDELQQALYAKEIALLASQTPTEHGTMLTPGYPGMVYYPEQRFYTLPGGQQIPEATYQQAVAEGKVEELIHYYTAYGTERAPGSGTVFMAPPSVTAAPAATVLGASAAKDASDAAAKIAADAAAKAAADAAAAAAKKVAANGGAAAGFDLTKFLKDNQTLLLIAVAGAGALFLLKGKG